MGGSTSIITNEQLEEYVELTYLTKHEVLYIFNKFKILGESELTENFNHRFNDLCIMEQFQQLKYNPFRERIFEVFSSKKDKCFSFEDFLDLCSVMSENCPLKVKAAWAFKMFDFNGDSQITKDDLFAVLESLTRPKELTFEEKDYICNIILQDTDLLTSGGMSQLEFLHAITKMPEFSNTFYFKI